MGTKNKKRKLNANLPYEMRLYSHLMIIAAALFGLLFFHLNGSQTHNWNLIILLSVLTSILLLKPFLVLSENIAYYIDDIPVYASIFLLGVSDTLLVILIGFTLSEGYKLLIKIYKKERPNLKSAYLSYSNIGQMLLSYGCAGIVFAQVNGAAPFTGSIQNIFAAILCASTKFFINAVESTFSVYVNERHSFYAIWKKNFSGIWVHLLMLSPLGFIFAYLISNNAYLSIFLVLPVFVLYYGCISFKKILAHTNRIFYTLVKSIDKRDHYTFGHSQRVASYAKALAKKMRLNPADILTAERAGKIHDLGKIGLSDDILQKKGRLAEEEILKMREHPSISLQIFKNLRHLKKYIPAEIASMHHEKYDGTGYVLGLKGKDIPLVSRILAAADTFDAMTSQRIYQNKLSNEEAVGVLETLKGTQLDPQVVDAFISLYESGVIDRIKANWDFSEQVYKKISYSEDLEKKYLHIRQTLN